MSKSRKAAVVDGYSALRAAQRAAVGGPPGDATEIRKPAEPALRTVVPTKHRIICYECGYSFQLHGRTATTTCSKCRAKLDLTDHTIERKWTETLKTAGTIRLTSQGKLESGELIGGDVVLEGIVEGGTVKAYRRLELGAGAVFPEKSVSAPDLRIAPGAVITLEQTAEYRDVEVLGTLNASLRASGVITIKAGGCLQGEVRGEHLVVEDGGALDAAVCIARRTDK